MVPSSAATMLEPSFTTTQVTRSRLRIQLEGHAGDLDLVAGLEPLGLERAQHPDALEPPLEVRQRLLVVEVVTGQQPLDPLAGDREAGLAGAPHRVAARRGGPEHPVLGHLTTRLPRRHRDSG